MVRKALVIIFSLFTAAILVSGGYSAWEETLIINGRITVLPPPKPPVVTGGAIGIGKETTTPGGIKVSDSGDKKTASDKKTEEENKKIVTDVSKSKKDEPIKIVPDSQNTESQETGQLEDNISTGSKKSQEIVPAEDVSHGNNEAEEKAKDTEDKAKDGVMNNSEDVNKGETSSQIGNTINLEAAIQSVETSVSNNPLQPENINDLTKKDTGTAENMDAIVSTAKISAENTTEDVTSDNTEEQLNGEAIPVTSQTSNSNNSNKTTTDGSVGVLNVEGTLNVSQLSIDRGSIDKNGHLCGVTLEDKVKNSDKKDIIGNNVYNSSIDSSDNSSLSNKLISVDNHINQLAKSSYLPNGGT